MAEYIRTCIHTLGLSVVAPLTVAVVACACTHFIRTYVCSAVPLSDSLCGFGCTQCMLHAVQHTCILGVCTSQMTLTVHMLTHIHTCTYLVRTTTENFHQVHVCALYVAYCMQERIFEAFRAFSKQSFKW